MPRSQHISLTVSLNEPAYRQAAAKARRRDAATLRTLYAFATLRWLRATSVERSARWFKASEQIAKARYALWANVTTR